tara:strand:- start:3546 stop:5033 length:1488 start_codon:yes stop_codon:yes gene_type:complete
MQTAEENWLESYSRDRTDQRLKRSWAENAPPETDSDYLFDKDRADVEVDVKEQDLYTDTNWVVSSKLIYDKFMRPSISSAQQGEKNVGTVGPEAYANASKRIMNSNNATGPQLLDDIPFEQMTDEQKGEYAKFGLEFMGTFNYNLPMMGIRTAQLAGMEDDTKFRFLQMMKTYDDKEITWSGTARFFKNMLTDPTTYVGLGTLGIGVVGRHGAQQATKQGIITAFKQSIKNPTALAAYEGGTYFAADNALRQSVQIQGGEQQDGFDFGESAGSLATGMLFGGALSKGANWLADAVSPTERLLKKVYKNAEEAQANIIDFLNGVTENPIAIDGKDVITGSKVTNPGVKTEESMRRKIDKKGYKDESEITDVVRAGIDVSRPDESDAIAKLLADNYEVIDEGWQAKPGGYFDRKILVTTPSGKTAEVQIWSEEISGVKQSMWDIYDEARKIQGDKKQKVKYEKLMKNSEQIAASALIAGADVWRPIYDQINLTVPGI